MEDENVSLDKLIELFQNRLKLFANYFEMTGMFYNSFGSNSDQPEKWKEFLDNRQEILKKIEDIENLIFDNLRCADKNASKILYILRSKNLKDVISIEISTRKIINNILELDKKLNKAMDDKLKDYLSEFAQFEANKHIMKNSYLKQPDMPPRFLNRKDQ